MPDATAYQTFTRVFVHVIIYLLFIFELYLLYKIINYYKLSI